jgi:hypothetical protein
MRYKFELDTAFNVLKAVDVTNNHNREFWMKSDVISF